MANSVPMDRQSSLAGGRGDGLRLASLALGSAVMALGALGAMALAWGVFFTKDIWATLGVVSVRYAFAGESLRRDIVHSVAFELALVWTVLFLAILSARSGMLRTLAPASAGGVRGN